MNSKDARDLMIDALRIQVLRTKGDKFAPHAGGCGLVADSLLKLRRLGREADTHATRLCSDEYYCKRLGEHGDETKRTSIHNRVCGVLADLGLPYGQQCTVIEVGGDPRGSCLKLKFSDGTELFY